MNDYKELLLLSSNNMVAAAPSATWKLFGIVGNLPAALHNVYLLLLFNFFGVSQLLAYGHTENKSVDQENLIALSRCEVAVQRLRHKQHVLKRSPFYQNHLRPTTATIASGTDFKCAACTH